MSTIYCSITFLLHTFFKNFCYMIKKYDVEYLAYVPADDEIYGDIQMLIGEYDTFDEAFKSFEEYYESGELLCNDDEIDVLIIGERFYEDDCEDFFPEDGTEGEILSILPAAGCPRRYKYTIVNRVLARDVKDVPQV